MKKYINQTIITLLILLCSSATFAQEKKIAMLEPVAVTDDISIIVKRMIRGELTKSISKESGFNAFTREDIDKMLTEHNFQESGMVNDAQRLKLGEMTGADYICISKVTKDGSSYYLEAFLIHCETGKIENPATAYVEGGISSVNKGCQQMANEMVGRKNYAQTQIIEETTTVDKTPEEKADKNPNNFLILKISSGFKDYEIMVSDREFEGVMDEKKARYNCANLNYGGYKNWRIPTSSEIKIIASKMFEYNTFKQGKYYWAERTGSSQGIFYTFKTTDGRSFGEFGYDTGRVLPVRTIEE